MCRAAAAGHRSNSVASPPRSSSTTPTSTWPRSGQSLFAATLANNGQVCFLGTRVLAPRSRYDEVVDTFAHLMSSAPRRRRPRRVDPHRPARQPHPAGPGHRLHRRRHSPRVPGSSSAAPAAPTGSTAGGSSARRCSTTSTTTPRIAREEIFGPVLTVIEYHDDAEAIRDRQRLRLRPRRHASGPPTPTGHSPSPAPSAPARSASTATSPTRRAIRRCQGQRHRQGVRPRGPGRVPEAQVRLPVRLTVFRVP